MDETRAPVLDPGRGRTKTGWLWALARDDRPWGGADPPGVVYFYAPGRGVEHAEEFLGGFDGILQVDGMPATTGSPDPAARAVRRCGLLIAGDMLRLRLCCEETPFLCRTGDSAESPQHILLR